MSPHIPYVPLCNLPPCTAHMQTETWSNLPFVVVAAAAAAAAATVVEDIMIPDDPDD